MKLFRASNLLVASLLMAGTDLVAKTTLARKAPESDIASIENRRVTVDMAAGLAKQESPTALPEELPLPFNPQGFNRVVREEPRTEPGARPAPRISGDREILITIASRVLPTGTFSLGGERFLQFSKKRLKVGDKLTVTHEGQDYTLELTAIDATNFTLRLNREEITRPIKPGKNP